MIDLRQIMPQGRKRIGLLIGASAPTSHNPMAGFTGYVLEKLTTLAQQIRDRLPPETGTGTEEGSERGAGIDRPGLGAG